MAGKYAVTIPPDLQNAHGAAVGRVGSDELAA